MKTLNSIEDFDKALSKESVFVVFKHSPRCSLSGGVCKSVQSYISAANRMHESLFMVDVVNQRELSLHIADIANIKHESPQIILFVDGKPSAHASHMAITQSLLSSWSATHF